MIDVTSAVRSRRILPILVFCVSLALYTLTLAPTVTLVDSGELIWTAYALDIPHPPGFPLHVLLGWLFAHLPLGTVAQRLNWMSAFFSALATALLFLIASRVLCIESPPVKAKGQQKRAYRREPNRGRGAAASELASRQPDISPALPALAAALSFAFSLTHWSWATVTEVYALSTCGVTAILLLLLRWRTDTQTLRHGGVHDTAGSADRALCAAAFVCGLALGNHVVSIAVLAPGIAYLLLASKGWRYWVHRRTLVAALFLILGLCIYLFLPLRAAQRPLLNWGNPVDAQRFLWQATGKQYRVNLFSSPLPRIGEKLLQFLRMWPREFAWIGMLLALWGLIVSWRRDRRLSWFLLLVIAADVFYALNYDIAEDIEAYYLPAFVITAVWLAVGMDDLMRRVRQRPRLSRLRWAILLIPTVVLAVNYVPNDKRHYYIARDYAENTFSCIEKDGLFLTRDWQFYSPSLYLQLVEGLRTDVSVVDTELLRRTWYFDYLRRRDPALLQAAGSEVDAFLQQLYLFEYDRPYDAAEIQQRYIAMINALLAAAESAGRPIYVGMDMEAGIGTLYSMAPRGLVFRLDDTRAFYPPHIALNLRGLNDGSVYLDDVARKVRRTYAIMSMNEGAYVSSWQQYEDALAAYQVALTLDPGSALAHERMGDSYRSLNRGSEALSEYQAAFRLEPGNQALQLKLAELKRAMGL